MYPAPYRNLRFTTTTLWYPFLPRADLSMINRSQGRQGLRLLHRINRSDEVKIYFFFKIIFLLAGYPFWPGPSLCDDRGQKSGQRYTEMNKRRYNYFFFLFTLHRVEGQTEIFDFRIALPCDGKNFLLLISNFLIFMSIVKLV